MEYTWDGLTGDRPTVPAGGKVYVRVDIASELEEAYEGAETFGLKASYSNNPDNSATDDATLIDDGTGTRYAGDFTGGEPDTEAEPAVDHRPLSVEAEGPVNEASPYAMFTVTAEEGFELDLALVDPSTGTEADYADFSFEYSLDGTTWVTYTWDGSTGDRLTVPAGGKVYVRADIATESELDYDGAERFALQVNYSNNPDNSATDDAAIIDDGTGTRYLGDINAGEFDTDLSSLRDDRLPDGPPGDDPVQRNDAPLPAPPPAPAPTAPPAAPAPPLVVPVDAPPPPAPAPNQSFASTLQPLAPKTPTAEYSLTLPETVTSGLGYQIPVIESAPPGLTVNRGVTDQFVQGTDVATKISLPFDAFMHSNKDAVIKLEARTADNASLPSWVQFDPATGVFEVSPPPGFKGKIDVKVVGRDDDGREATVIFQMFVGEPPTQNRSEGRDSLAEKLRLAAKRPLTLVRSTDGVHLPVREPQPMNVRIG